MGILIGRAQMMGWWCWLFISGPGLVLAQNNRMATRSVADSVVGVLNQQLQLTQQDTTRIVLIGKLATRYQQLGQLDSAFSCLQVGLGLAQKTKRPLNLGRMYYQLGNYYDGRFLATQCINDYRRAIPLLHQSGKVAESTEVMYSLARVYTGRGLFVNAIDQIRKNLAYATQTGYYKRLGSAYALLYEIHTGLNDQKSMYNDLLSMLAVAHEQHNPIDYYLANEYFGQWYEAKHDYVKALPYWKKALQIAEQTQRSVLITIMNSYIANNLIRQKRLNEAEPFMTKTFEEAKKDKQISLIYANKVLARLREQQNRLTEAYQLVRQGMEHERKNNPSTYLESLEILLNIQEKQGNYKQALATFRTLKVVSDSLQEINKLRAVASIDSRIALEKQIEVNLVLKKNSAIQKLEIEHKRQEQIGYIGITAALLVILLLLVWFDWQTRKNLTRLNQQKVEITSQAERLQELNSFKDKLFSLIGHDLRGPVMNLKSSLNQLQKNRLSPDQFTHLAEKLKRTVDSLYSTLDNLLHWSALQREGLITKTQWVDLMDQITETLELQEPMASQKNITVTVSPNPIMIWTDESQAQIVIRNILQNALKFTPIGGHIHISFEHLHSEAVVRIADTGIGMSITNPHQAAQYLTRRGTLGETGTGLGLLVCDEFMKRNGGRMEIESEIGKGTTVNLFFLAREGIG